MPLYELRIELPYDDDVTDVITRRCGFNCIEDAFGSILNSIYSEELEMLEGTRFVVYQVEGSD